MNDLKVVTKVGLRSVEPSPKGRGGSFSQEEGQGERSGGMNQIVNFVLKPLLAWKGA
jgi:hypothetical protein